MGAINKEIPEDLSAEELYAVCAEWSCRQPPHGFFIVCLPSGWRGRGRCGIHVKLAPTRRNPTCDDAPNQNPILEIALVMGVMGWCVVKAWQPLAIRNFKVGTDPTTNFVASDPYQQNTSKMADVYPLFMLDDNKTLHGIVVAWTLRFNDVLDPNLLHSSLSRLLEIGDWRKVGGRLRRE
ncbi:hypothetical protein V492_01742, partial [Pseudogymnoascus sp. VKM F-4246]